LDTAKQEEIYLDLTNKSDNGADGVKKMKPSAKVSIVLERHMWAAWLKENYLSASFNDVLGYQEPTFKHFGTYIEDRLNEVGISDLAGVELTGHWYSSNSSGYGDDLLRWARIHRGSIKVGEPD
jgi:hypothetical protein